MGLGGDFQVGVVLVSVRWCFIVCVLILAAGLWAVYLQEMGWRFRVWLILGSGGIGSGGRSCLGYYKMMMDEEFGPGDICHDTIITP